MCLVPGLVKQKTVFRQISITTRSEMITKGGNVWGSRKTDRYIYTIIASIILLLDL